MTSKQKTDPCAALVRTKPNITINDEIATEIGRNYRTLPIFEKGLFEYTFRKHNSLQTNELLKCRWEKYKREFDERVFAPFEFLDIRDYHFYNCRNRLIPAVSIHTKTDFRRMLKPGPGVDRLGQMPIPQELLMKRGEQKKADKKKGRKKEKGNKVDKPVEGEAAK